MKTIYAIDYLDKFFITIDPTGFNQKIWHDKIEAMNDKDFDNPSNTQYKNTNKGKYIATYTEAVTNVWVKTKDITIVDAVTATIV